MCIIPAARKTIAVFRKLELQGKQVIRPNLEKMDRKSASFSLAGVRRETKWV